MKGRGPRLMKHYRLYKKKPAKCDLINMIDKGAAVLNASFWVLVSTGNILTEFLNLGLLLIQHPFDQIANGNNPQ